MANNYIRMFDFQDKIKGSESSREALKLIGNPNRKRVSTLPSQFSGKEPKQETDWSKIKQSYNLFEDEYVTIASKKEIKHLNKYDAIGHVLLMDPDGIKELRKVIERMLVQGEYRDKLMEQLDEIESEAIAVY